MKHKLMMKINYYKNMCTNINVYTKIIENKKETLLATQNLI